MLSQSYFLRRFLKYSAVLKLIDSAHSSGCQKRIYTSTSLYCAFVKTWTSYWFDFLCCICALKSHTELRVATDTFSLNENLSLFSMTFLKKNPYFWYWAAARKVCSCGINANFPPKPIHNSKRILISIHTILHSFIRQPHKVSNYFCL